MTFFRWQTALNSESKTSARDRRRGSRAQRTRFRPWADRLEDRVVLSYVYTPGANSVATLESYLRDANNAVESNGKSLSSQGYTSAEIDLTVPFKTGNWTSRDVQPDKRPRPRSEHRRQDTGAVTIISRFQREFLTIGPCAGVVSINVGSTSNNSITLQDGNASAGQQHSGNGSASIKHVPHFRFECHQRHLHGQYRRQQWRPRSTPDKGSGPVDVDNSILRLPVDSGQQGDDGQRRGDRLRGLLFDHDHW